MHYFLRFLPRGSVFFAGMFFLPLALAALEGRPTLLPYVPGPYGIFYFLLIFLIFSFIVEIKQNFDFFRKSFDVVVHTSKHNNERNDTD
jgi:hypothetical protein|tara:strand:+ start:6889 stop:7155 length:267 start_codon:yes stop_codon:yes gene_type:complete